jgi:phosphonate metabolism-associated iron-containing alcohol dehydrogenase
MSWAYWNPVRIGFGPGQFDQVSAQIAGRSYALVTYGTDYFRGRSTKLAATAGEPVVTIDNIDTNPDFKDLVESCRRFGAAATKPAVIVALGGGSMIDAAKVLAASGGDFARVKRHLMERIPLDPATFLPIIAVPTTSGTGSEVTSWATVWDAAGSAKYSLAHPRLYPEAALVDPALTLGAPHGLTLSTGLDALSHSLESLWNVNANPVSANFAVESAREILNTLPHLLERLDDLDLRARLARASLFAGLAFSNTKTALAHNISYGITLRRGTPHGIACSFCLPQVMEWAIGANRACDAALERIFGPDLRAGVQRLTRFIRSVGVGTEPSDHGVGRDEWDDLVERATAGERGRNFIGRVTAMQT